MEALQRNSITRPWVISLPLGSENLLTGLWDLGQAEVLQSAERIWLKDKLWNDSYERRFHSLLGCECFWSLPDKQLLPHGCQVVNGYLPEGDWVPLQKWLQFALPVRDEAFAVPARTPLKLLRSSNELPANLILLSLEDWHEYVISAPQVRLRPLEFSVSEDCFAFVQGSPLPPNRWATVCKHRRDCGSGWLDVVTAS